MPQGNLGPLDSGLEHHGFALVFQRRTPRSMPLCPLWRSQSS